MALPEFSMRQLLEAGVHFGHQTHRWNPKMAPYIFGARSGIHIMDLSQTVPLLHQALKEVRDVAAKGGRVLFVGTKRSASEPVASAAKRCAQYYVNHRWLGGKPDLMFVIDTNKENIAIKEARRLGIPVVAILDTNCDPAAADMPIPGNDDAARAIQLYCELIADAVLDGMTEAQASLGQDIGASEHIEEVMLQTPVAEPAVEAPVVEAPAAEAAPAAALTDISLVDGIGPKYKAALEAAGVTSLQMMAELSDEKIAEVEAAASLEGKFAAGEWKVQAQEIVSGKAPRAKVDQAAAAKA